MGGISNGETPMGGRNKQKNPVGNKPMGAGSSPLL